MNEIVDKDDNLDKKGKDEKGTLGYISWKKGHGKRTYEMKFGHASFLLISHLYYKNNRMISEYPDGHIENV